MYLYITFMYNINRKYINPKLLHHLYMYLFCNNGNSPHLTFSFISFATTSPPPPQIPSILKRVEQCTYRAETMEPTESLKWVTFRTTHYSACRWIVHRYLNFCSRREFFYIEKIHLKSAPIFDDFILCKVRINCVRV